MAQGFKSGPAYLSFHVAQLNVDKYPEHSRLNDVHNGSPHANCIAVALQDHKGSAAGSAHSVHRKKSHFQKDCYRG